MEAMTAEKLNRSYTRLSLRPELLGLPFGTQLLVGDVASFTGEDKGGKKLSCKRGIKEFKKRLGISRATVCRAKKAAIESGLITGDKKQGFESTFKVDDGKFLRLPNWACTDEFTVRKGQKRKLTNSEKQVYAYFNTECTKKRNGKHVCEASIADIAATLGLSERTVQRAIWTLIRAGLIYRSKKDKGVNAHKKSRYTLNFKLVLIKEKTENEIRKEAEKETSRADEEPFPEFAPTSEAGQEEFKQHSKPAQPKKKTAKKDIPEREAYRRGLLDYDFTGVSNEALSALLRLYLPQWDYLDNRSQSFLMYIENELKERGSPPRGEL